jgi:hypothetical protein
MPISIPSGRTLPLQSKAGGGFRSFGFLSFIAASNWLAHSQTSRAPAPLLRFTDLISGPATGLGDSLGSGVIVTIWAQGVGDTQGTGQVYFNDANGTRRAAAHVYYWKRADGVLPSGPARLWYSHLMQEIAFSIPAGSVNGAGTITVETGGNTSNSLPFTVRAGSIYHVKSTGADSNPGTWASSYLTHDGAINNAPAGSTIYVHDVDAGTAETPVDRGYYWSNLTNSSSQTAQMSSVSYPNNRPQIFAQRGAANRTNEGWVISKVAFYCSERTSVDENDQPVGARYISSASDSYCAKTSSLGRLIANLMTDVPGWCASSQNGAIASGDFSGNDAKIFGNEIYEYGCAGSSSFHHTTYMTIRGSITTQIKAWEFGYNFLWGNHAKNGLHSYDQPGASSGGLTTDLKVHHNVICEQGGAGINIGTNTGWNVGCYVENNVLIDTGRASDWDGINPDTASAPLTAPIAINDGTPDGLPSIVQIRNNLAYRFKADGINTGTEGALTMNGEADVVDVRYNNNLAWNDRDIAFFEDVSVNNVQTNNVTGANNAWHYEGATPIKAIEPSWSAAGLTSDPLISLDGAIVTLSSNSPAKAGSNATVPAFLHDIYGVPRPATYTIGPVEAN